MKKNRISIFILLLFGLFSMNVNAAAYVPDDNAWIAGGVLDGDLSFENNQISFESGSSSNTLSFFSSDYSLIGKGRLNSFDTGISNLFSLTMNNLSGYTRTLYGSIQNKFSYVGALLALGIMESTGEVNNSLVANVQGTNIGLFAGTFEEDIKMSATPIPAAVWLFGSGLIAVFGLTRKKQKSVNI